MEALDPEALDPEALDAATVLAFDSALDYSFEDLHSESLCQIADEFSSELLLSWSSMRSMILTAADSFSLSNLELVPWIDEFDEFDEFELLYELNTNCWNSDSDVNFRLTSSESGGFYIHVGSSAIHVPKYLSVHHPITQMLLFAEDSNGLEGSKFSCPISVAPMGITAMHNRQLSSAFPNVYEAGWVPSRQLPLDAFNPVEMVDVNGFRSLPVLFDKSTDEVTVSNVSSRQRASVSIIADEAKIKPLVAGAGVQDSVNLMLDSVSSVLPTGIPLRQHYLLNEQTDESSDKPRPHSAPAINPSYEAARTPMACKGMEEDSENHSNPNPGVTEPVSFEKTKRSAPWYVATGAAHHATGNRDLLTILEVENNSGLFVHAADGTPLRVCGRGNVVTDTVVIPDVWFVPGLDVNLVSVGQLAELDYSIGFARGSCTICNACDTVVGRAHAREDGLYEVDFLEVPLGMHSNIK